MTNLRFTNYSFDIEKGSLFSEFGATQESEVVLRNKVAKLLEYLITHRDRVISKDELLTELWDHGEYRETALTQSIRELRKILGDDAKQPKYIRTFPQRGYQWIAAVAETDESNKDVALEPTVGSAEESNAVTRLWSAKRLATMLIPAVLVVALLGVLTTGWLHNRDYTSDDVTIPSRTSLIVLPVINETGDVSMNWLQLGLADMLAGELSHQLDWEITPPAAAQQLLLATETPWPALPYQVRALLKARDRGVALTASVSLHEGQQVFNFSLQYADGETREGQVTYTSLAAAVPAIAEQIRHLLAPEEASRHREVPKTIADPYIAQAYAKGLHALQTEGALAAQRYFQAAAVLAPENLWIAARLAQTYIMLGDWKKADSSFLTINNAASTEGVGLMAFIQYWRAELAFRRGGARIDQHLDTAIELAEDSRDTAQLALVYRLKAQRAWQQDNWIEHHRWLVQADQLSGNTADLHTQAEKSFYLGNPSNEGLEKNPLNDLEKNQRRLEKALNYYRSLDHTPMVAATHLAIAQNYLFTPEVREQSLQEAISGFRSLQQPYELAQALIYAGFYNLQLHQGDVSEKYFEEADGIATDLEAIPLQNYAQFYLAFAKLDQGLNQSMWGRHAQNTKVLRQAIEQLGHVLKRESDRTIFHSALIFLGWAHTDLGESERAKEYLQQALNSDGLAELPTTRAYAVYSLMYLYLLEENYDAVIALEKYPVLTRLQALYLAEAYYAKGNIEQAESQLIAFKQRFPALWKKSDERKLLDYRLTATNNEITDQTLSVGELMAPHFAYCESDWVQ